MKRRLALVILCTLSTLIAACGPSTATPTKPTAGPTGVSAATLPAVQPTPNFQATEAVMVAHVVASLTASAPTAPRPAATQPVATARPPTAAPKVKATAKPTVVAATPVPAAPSATIDPYLSQIPKGMGGMVVVNYVGDHDAIVTLAGQVKTIKSNERALFVLAPGKYSFSVSIAGVTGVLIPPLNGVQLPPVAGGNWSDERVITADKYFIYPLSLSPTF